MTPTDKPVTQRSLFSWVLSGNLKLQLLLVVVIMVTVFARVVPLEMQKRIVNQAINLRKMDLLLTYCGIYLAAVIVAGGLKYLINVLETVIGQRALAEMRKGLYHHILTLPLNFFRKTQPGMVVSSLVTELTTAGTFVGMALAVPVTNVLTLLAFAGYLLWLNPLLAVVSLSIYPIVLLLVPLLQKQANKSNKQRVDVTRTLSSRIAESISGIHEIHSNGAYPLENKKYDRLIDRLLKIRTRWSLYKYGVKTLNNFFNNLSPFLIFILGGYLAMKGRLELGALVAFLSAQEKLYNPWKEMIEFYQVYQDASVRYRRTMTYFNRMPEHALAPADRTAYHLDADLQIKDLSFVTEGGIALLDNISLDLKAGEHLALVGFSGSGKSTLAQCVGQLYKYTGGIVKIGNQEVAQLSKKDMINNVGFVAQHPFIFEGTIEENLLYGCSAALAGNGHQEDGGLPSLDDRIAVLQHTGIFTDVLRFGLITLLTPGIHEDLTRRIVNVRRNFQADFGELLADHVEFFSDDSYLYHSSISENLTLGSANRPEFEPAQLPTNSYFRNFLDKADLTRPLLSLGSGLTRQTVDILGNLPPDEVFFEQSPINATELDDYKLLVQRLKQARLHQLSESDQQMLLTLALRFTPGVHKMVGLPSVLEDLILEGRALFRDKVAAEHPGAFSFFQQDEYLYSQTILNNILFGKPTSSSHQTQEKINQSIIQLLIEEDLLETILEIGMQFEVGTKGDKLSGGQRQKLAIARAFLKNPRLLIMDEATSALDNNSQARIQNLIDSRYKGKSTLISVVHRLDIVKKFDKIAVMRAGKIVEIGTYEELINQKGVLYELVAGKQ